MSLVLNEQVPQHIRGRRHQEDRGRYRHRDGQASAPRHLAGDAELVHQVRVRQQQRHVVVLPASLRNKKHRQDDQRELAKQPGVRPAIGLRAAKDREQSDQDQRECLDQPADDLR